MTDHRLHGSQRDLRGAGSIPEHAAQRLDLRLVPHRHGGAVRLDESHAGRGDPRRLVGAPERQLLSLDARGEHRLCPPVARCPDGPDERVDSVAVPLRVAQALQEDHSRALTQHGAVGVAIEGAQMRAVREGPHVGEHVVDGGRRGNLDPTHQRGVTSFLPKIVQGAFDGDERGCAGRVERAVHSTQVEAVGDPAGDETRGHAARRLGGDRRQARLEALSDRVQLGRVVLGVQLAKERNELVDRHLVLELGERSAVHEGPAPQDHLGVLAVEGKVGEPRIQERLVRKFQRQELIWLGSVHRARHDAERPRIESREVADVAAPHAVQSCFLPRLEERSHIATLRRVADRVHLPDDVLPV